jgi:hypothetical protein
LSQTEVASPKYWQLVVAAVTSGCSAEIRGEVGGPSARAPTEIGKEPETLPTNGTEGGVLPRNDVQQAGRRVEPEVTS